MGSVNETIQGMFTSAKVQMEGLGQRTRRSLAEAPEQIKSGWTDVVHWAQRELGCALLKDVQEASDRTDVLSRQVEALSRQVSELSERLERLPQVEGKEGKEHGGKEHKEQRGRHAARE